MKEDKVKCEVCGEKANYRQFGRDDGFYYFCDVEHHKDFIKEHIYRALELEPIETLDNKIINAHISQTKVIERAIK